MQRRLVIESLEQLIFYYNCKADFTLFPKRKMLQFCADGYLTLLAPNNFFFDKFMNILRSFTNNETVDYQEFHQLGRLKQYEGEVIRENGRVFLVLPKVNLAHSV